MPKIRNVSPYGDLEVPLLQQVARVGGDVTPVDLESDPDAPPAEPTPTYGVVEAGQVIEVSEAQASVLLLQAENWQPVGDESHAIVAQLKAEAAGDAMPSTSDLKGAWIDWATLQGDPDPESTTKQELIDTYGRPAADATE